jgi:hypothetical protein
MSIRVYCDSPEELLLAIKRGVRSRSIETWQLDSDGDFTHVPDQWKNRAWFHPVVREECLLLNIFGRKTEQMSKTIYGVYHGRFVEMLLMHFDSRFKRVSCTALASSGDRVGGSGVQDDNF